MEIVLSGGNCEDGRTDGRTDTEEGILVQTEGGGRGGSLEEMPSPGEHAWRS